MPGEALQDEPMMKECTKLLIVLATTFLLQNFCLFRIAFAQPQAPNPGPTPRPRDAVDKEISDRITPLRDSVFRISSESRVESRANPLPFINNGCNRRTAHDGQAVERALREKRQAAIYALSGIPEARALAAYIADEFPTKVPIRSDNCFNRPIVYNHDLQGIMYRASAVLAVTGGGSSYALQKVTIVSTPEGATFTYAPKGGGQTEITTTNTSKEYIWRGRYKYEITKDGYLMGFGELTIVNGQSATIFCKLEKEHGSSAGSKSAACDVRTSHKEE